MQQCAEQQQRARVRSSPPTLPPHLHHHHHHVITYSSSSNFNAEHITFLASVSPWQQVKGVEARQVKVG